MPIVAGSLLVLATWAIAVPAVMLVGLLPASMTASTRRQALQTSLWWGLSIAVVLVLLLSLLLPLGSPAALGALAVLVILAGAAGLAAFRRLPPGGAPVLTGTRWLVIGALGLAVVYLAVAALAPVTNYDTGLYHLGALRYQQEFGLVPGIANLYFPLGYGNSVIPLSAFLGSTFWDANGFRLLNGLLLVLLAAETVLRLTRRRWSPGTFLLLGTLVFVWIPMVALSDYWVTSPTSDSSVLILTTVSVAYLADAIARRTGGPGHWNDLAVALVTSWVLVSMRPTMAVFAAGVIAVATVLAVRGRQGHAKATTRRDLVVAGSVVVIGLAVMVLQVLRDRILSGWIQYPLSLFSFDVPWRAPDPVWFRTATLGAARDPEDLWAAAEGWQWIPGWLARLPTQWEFLLAMVLAAGSTLLVIVAVRWKAPWRPRAAALAALPSLLTVVAWLVASPPSFRFIWGPLFTLVTLPGAFAAHGLVGRREARPTSRRFVAVLPVGAALGLLAVTLFSGVARLDLTAITVPQEAHLGPATVTYAVAPLPLPPTQDAMLESGLTVRFPTESDQCWAVYPLCTAQLDQSVRLAGPTLAEGFLP